MFSPGKKNWIKKFFALQKQGEINLEVLIFSEESNTEERIRELCDYTGVLYGIPNQQLYTSAYVGASTRNENFRYCCSSPYYTLIIYIKKNIFLRRSLFIDWLNFTSFLFRRKNQNGSSYLEKQSQRNN